MTEPLETTRWSRLDPRSLAVFRIALGFLVATDQILRLRDLTTFYTDAGVLPRTTLLGSNLSDFWLSLHMSVGDPLGEFVLILITAAFGLGLMVGWRSRWMALGAWAMLNSLLARNPFVNDRGDTQLVLMLFWGMFLPLGACWSMDARRRAANGGSQKCPGSPIGWPAAGLILQFALIYLMAAVTKRGDYWLGRGDALEYSLASPIFARPLAGWVLSHCQPFLVAINYLVIVGELFAGLLLLCPFSVGLLRGVAVGLILSFHLGVGLLFDLGLFPFTGGLCILALLPSEFWGFLPRFALKELDFEEPEGFPRYLRDAFLMLGLSVALLSNWNSLPGAENHPLPPALTKLSGVLRLEQHWDLFSPLPPINGQFRLVAFNTKGDRRVLFQGPPTSGDPQAQPFPDHRFRMLMLTTLFPDYPFMAQNVAKELAVRAGGLRPGEKLQYEFMLHPMLGNGKFGEPRALLLWRQVDLVERP